MSLVNGGASFRLFNPCVYNLLCWMDAADLIAGINEVPDCGVLEAGENLMCSVTICHTPLYYGV